MTIGLIYVIKLGQSEQAFRKSTELFTVGFTEGLYVCTFLYPLLHQKNNVKTRDLDLIQLNHFPFKQYQFNSIVLEEDACQKKLVLIERFSTIEFLIYHYSHLSCSGHYCMIYAMYMFENFRHGKDMYRRKKIKRKVWEYQGSSIVFWVFCLIALKEDIWQVFLLNNIEWIQKTRD